MNLLSINVSGIKKVDDNGRDVSTGIFKEPVEGSVNVSNLNLAGDDQGRSLGVPILAPVFLVRI